MGCRGQIQGVWVGGSFFLLGGDDVKHLRCLISDGQIPQLGRRYVAVVVWALGCLFHLSLSGQTFLLEWFFSPAPPNMLDALD